MREVTETEGVNFETVLPHIEAVIKGLPNAPELPLVFTDTEPNLLNVKSILGNPGAIITAYSVEAGRDNSLSLAVLRVPHENLPSDLYRQYKAETVVMSLLQDKSNADTDFPVFFYRHRKLKALDQVAGSFDKVDRYVKKSRQTSEGVDLWELIRGEEVGNYFESMRLGQDIDRRSTEMPITMLQVVNDVCYFHKIGLSVPDRKPSDFVRESNGHVRIFDFNVSAAEPGSELADRLTQAGYADQLQGIYDPGRDGLIATKCFFEWVTGMPALSNAWDGSMDSLFGSEVVDTAKAEADRIASLPSLALRLPALALSLKLREPTQKDQVKLFAENGFDWVIPLVFDAEKMRDYWGTIVVFSQVPVDQVSGIVETMERSLPGIPWKLLVTEVLKGRGEARVAQDWEEKVDDREKELEARMVGQIRTYTEERRRLAQEKMAERDGLNQAEIDGFISGLRATSPEDAELLSDVLTDLHRVAPGAAYIKANEGLKYLKDTRADACMKCLRLMAMVTFAGQDIASIKKDLEPRYASIVGGVLRGDIGAINELLEWRKYLLPKGGKHVVNPSSVGLRIAVGQLKARDSKYVQPEEISAEEMVARFDEFNENTLVSRAHGDVIRYAQTEAEAGHDANAIPIFLANEARQKLSEGKGREAYLTAKTAEKFIGFSTSGEVERYVRFWETASVVKGFATFCGCPPEQVKEMTDGMAAIGQHMWLNEVTPADRTRVAEWQKQLLTVTAQFREQKKAEPTLTIIKPEESYSLEVDLPSWKLAPEKRAVSLVSTDIVDRKADGRVYVDEWDMRSRLDQLDLELRVALEKKTIKKPN